MNTILSVSQINTYIKSVIDYDENLKNIYICGEISNFTNHYRTGHFYFTVKDEKCAVKAVMFRQYAQNIRFEPYNGLKVIVRASVSVFERDGVYQLYVTDMQPDGLGELNLAYEQMKERLEAEGLFKPEFKKPIPAYPEKIAVITSPTGAAIRDIINVISRRYSLCEIQVIPVQVQGSNSASQIVDALYKVNAEKSADVIILGRGGGSIEDLWSFNEEPVARAIFASDIPVISAVGHETDFTISDFAADLRAPTPSVAAELATPDIFAVKALIEDYGNTITYFAEKKLSDMTTKVDNLKKTLLGNSPLNRLEREKERIITLKTEIDKAVIAAVNSKSIKLSYLSAQLDSLSPLKTLSRGYAIVFDEANKHISSADKLSIDEKISVRFNNGDAICTVDEVKCR